jgi:GNAT superfamily N-acetyltransferase
MQRTVDVDGAVLRPLTEGDLPAVQALSASVGWPHRLEDWALFLALGEGFAVCAPDGAILGTAMRWNWSADCATVGMVLVTPARQGSGLGRRLMQSVLGSRSQAVMLNATKAGLALYERLGFRPLGTVCQHQGQIHANVAASARRAAADDLAEIVALDRAAFGTARVGLIERLLWEGEVRVIERDSKLRGFAARRRFGRGEAIGPVVAESEADAVVLVGSLLRPGFQRIDIPADATALASWLTQAGLQAVDHVTVMVRGAWPACADIRRFALASQALG